MEVANSFKSHNLLNEVLDKILKTEMYLRDLRIGTGAKWSLNDDQNVCYTIIAENSHIMSSDLQTESTLVIS